MITELKEVALFALPSSLLICFIIALLRIGPPLALIVITLAYNITPNTGNFTTNVTPSTTVDFAHYFQGIIDKLIQIDNTLTSKLSNLTSATETVRAAVANVYQNMPTVHTNGSVKFNVMGTWFGPDGAHVVTADRPIPTLSFHRTPPLKDIEFTGKLFDNANSDLQEIPLSFIAASRVVDGDALHPAIVTGKQIGRAHV